MPTSTGGSAAARPAVTDDVAVLSFLAQARSKAAASASQLAAHCNSNATPAALAAVAAEAYLATGMLLALLNRLPKLK